MHAEQGPRCSNDADRQLPVKYTTMRAGLKDHIPYTHSSLTVADLPRAPKAGPLILFSLLHQDRKGMEAFRLKADKG